MGFVGFGVFVDGFDGGGGYELWVWAFEAKVVVGCENDGGFKPLRWWWVVGVVVGLLVENGVWLLMGLMH